MSTETSTERLDWTGRQFQVEIGAVAHGGHCVARHEGRVVFVRHALPGETVRVRVQSDRGSYWHADVTEVIEPSPDRIPSLCPIAGVDGAGCCDLAFVTPEGARRLKGAVVANQLARLGGYQWCDEDRASAEAIGDGAATLSSITQPADGPRSVQLYCESGTAAVTGLVVHRLRSGWEQD